MKQNKNRKVRKTIMWILLSVLGTTALIIGVSFILMMIKNAQVPKGGLGHVEGVLAKMPTSPNAVSSQSDDDLYRVEPLTIKGEVTESIELFLKACDQVGNYTIYVRKSDYMHLIFTTKTMKYNDDVEIYIDEEAGLIHYRSGSRVGYSDMGLNRVRYNQIADYYESN